MNETTQTEVQTLPGAEAVQQMTADEVRRLVEAVSSNGVTRKFIAEEAGYSGAALSSWMAGRYTKTGEDKTFEVALRSALERILQKRFFSGNKSARKFRRVATSVSEAVFLAAKTCQNQGLMGLLTGVGGRGKTTAAEMYAASNTNVIYVRTSPFMTRKQLMTAISVPCDVQEKSAYEMLVKICEKLQQAKSLVIIDEAENLSLDLLDAVRQINDWAGAGLLFIGQENFYTMLARARKSHEYLVDRFKLRMRVADLGLTDVQYLVTTEIANLNGHASAFLKACGGSARFLETLTYKLLPRLQGGEVLSDRMIFETAESVRIF
ncbi:MAG: AAA family ATPase [Chlorobiaceae bacterium]|nr:AAA family ATPase [Chlorobiaceae bacterium]